MSYFNRRALGRVTLALALCGAVTAEASATTRVASVHRATKAPLVAPKLRAVGHTLSWTRVQGVKSYVVRKHHAGHADSYWVVRGTSMSARSSRGRVTYRVRTAAIGSSWSFPKRFFTPPPAAKPAARASTKPAAPVTTPSVATRTVTATAAPSTPASWVTASAPSPAPASAAPAVSPSPAPAAPPALAGGPRVGVVVGSAIAWQLQFVKKLGARSARMDFPISTPVSEMAPIIEQYAAAGIEANLLATFAGRIPSAADIATLGSWASAFGPGGSFWAGKQFPASLAVDRIEFGNESSGPWQYASLAGVEDWAHAPQYIAAAEGYGRAFKDAAVKVRAVNPGVRLLAVADVAGRWQTWMDGMFRGAPDLADHVGGWVVHPYGPGWAQGVDDVLAQARSHGASDSIPLYATETGLATDDGRCLDDNYGWDPCMTYAQAGTTLTNSVAAIAARYRNRLAEIDLYSASDLRDHGASGAREDYFGALDATSGTKGAYTVAMQQLLAGSS